MMRGGMILVFAALTIAPAPRAPRAPMPDGPLYDLSWRTMDCGGGRAEGGGFALTATIGQWDTGAPSGGVYDLTGGFWAAPASVPCPGDLDGSGAVDFGDVLAILSAWGNMGGPEDLDESGTVDFGDVLIVLSSWGSCP